jgi:catechol 2,3-dioxygenase-like lactoylglutathione lyase family enzyme
MFQGLRTVIYRVNDLARAKEWYTTLLGYGPYFDEPFYVGFNVGGYELGLDPDAAGATPGDSVVTYWGVADARSALARLAELGAKERADVQEVGDRILVASVEDPFGNVVGIIENPHFKIAVSD